MFTPKTRIIIIIGCLGLLVMSLYQGKTYASVVALCFALITVIGYFRQGTVFMAFRQLRSGKIQEAAQSLELTKNTKWLSKIQKGYYYFVKGFVALGENKPEEAKTAYEEALKIGLRLSNDTAMVCANLASIHHKQKNKVKAREYIERAKNLKVKANVKAEIERLEKEIG